MHTYMFIYYNKLKKMHIAVNTTNIAFSNSTHLYLYLALKYSHVRIYTAQKN